MKNNPQKSFTIGLILYIDVLYEVYLSFFLKKKTIEEACWPEELLA